MAGSFLGHFLRLCNGLTPCRLVRHGLSITRGTGADNATERPESNPRQKLT